MGPSKSPARQDKEPRPKRWRRRICRFGVILAVLALVSPFVMVWIVSTGRSDTVEAVAAHDIAIVFGAGLYDGKPGPYLSTRLLTAVKLFEAGKVKVILVSGGQRPGYDEPGAMKRWLINYGVPADRIVKDNGGDDTYLTCARAKQVFGVDSAILVTQGYHIPRAVATCRMLGLDAVGVGDYTVKAVSENWGRYSRREVPAMVHLAWEIVTRLPDLGDHADGVERALGGI
ncbi:MAG: YdcF family protein [Propionibacteriaceae bacterium]|jgi:vancomycin permeability regulator SanA|nr:YdcF family protein [Propionibacteriaceae bacterium]